VSELRRFKATLEKLDVALGWTIARLPFDPGDAWQGMVRLRVRGEINGFAFRTSLFPATSGSYFLLVNKAMQRGSGAVLGSLAAFSLEPDRDERHAELPDELAALLDEEDGLRAFYHELTEYTRREIGKWIGGVKGEAARLKRCEQVAERLLATMEAERELPPLIASALKRSPQATAGWAKMTPLQRRHELMAVFYYQSPEARVKRLGKLVELAATKG
jgi:hypothetical protein